MINLNLACERLAEFIQPGDVLTYVWDPVDLLTNPLNLLHFKDYPLFAGRAAIQKYQEDYFGQIGFNKSTHVILYLGGVSADALYAGLPTAECFYECTTPVIRKFPIWEIAFQHIRILRYRYRKFDISDVAFMVKTAEPMLGQKYGYEQLVNFVIYALLKYPENSTPLLGGNKAKSVCSVWVRGLLEALRKRHEEIDAPNPMHRLFDIIDERLWRLSGKWDNVDHQLKYKDGQKGIRTAVEWTTPAHFDNSDYFQSEFDLIKEFKNGRVV
jgi:hypothetical protein